jgi:hypothetical protein
MEYYQILPRYLHPESLGISLLNLLVVLQVLFIHSYQMGNRFENWAGVGGIERRFLRWETQVITYSEVIEITYILSYKV